MRNRQNKLLTGIWLLAALLAVCLLIRLFGAASLWTNTAAGNDEASFGLRFKNKITSAAFRTCLPGLYYQLFESETAPDTFSLVKLCELQWHPSAVYTDKHKTTAYTAQSVLSPDVVRSDSISGNGDENVNDPEMEPANENSGTDSPAPLSTDSPSGGDKDDASHTAAPASDTQSASADTILRHGTPAGAVYTASQLSDFDYLLNNFYTLDATTTIDAALLNAEALLEKDLRLTQDNGAPQILIYHTHSQEDFIDSIPDDASTSIVAVGNYLTTLLTDVYGYNVIHDTSTYDLVDGTLDRNKAYTLALQSVSRILEQNPTIQVVIDLHRDGISGDKMTTTFNGKETAALMFFNGLSRTVRNGTLDSLPNPYIQDNLAFSLQMKLKAEKYYPGATRPIYLKGYRYNLHLRPRCLLVEAGSQKNTLQEEYNAMEILADVLDMVLSGEE